MIPKTERDLDTMIVEAGRQLSEIETIAGALDDVAVLWRPDRRRWSCMGHIAHLCLTNEPYCEVMTGRVSDARARGGLESPGPYRHPLIASWFARSMEPPPKPRIRTSRRLVPDPSLESTDVVGRFGEAQRGLITTMRQARGLDLGRIRFGSPFLAALRMSLGTGFETLLAHNRRHVWLLREVLALEGSPGLGALDGIG